MTTRVPKSVDRIHETVSDLNRFLRFFFFRGQRGWLQTQWTANMLDLTGHGIFALEPPSAVLKNKEIIGPYTVI